MTEQKRFDVYTELLHTGIGITDKGKELTGNDVVTLLNQLTNENEELKLDNDIKYWKQEYLQLSNHQQVIFHELAEAFKQGYKPSKEYQKMRNDEKKRIEECKQKMERLRI